MIHRRIIPRDELRGTAIERPCGIHDAFQAHGDGGAVRW